MFKNYVEGHAGTKVAADESDVKIKKLAQQNQQSLVAVLNADQLIQCEENITEEQISHIQKQKAAGITENLKIDSGLDDLVKVSFVKYDDLGVYSGKPAAIRLQPQQDAVLNLIQEISDTLAKSIGRTGSRSGLGLGYLDMTNSIAAQLMYMVGLLVFIGIAVFYFYNKTVVKQEEEKAKIQARKDEKKAKKSKKA